MKPWIFFALLASLPAAHAADDLDLPVDGGIASKGYDIAPVLKCPAVPEAYSKMITALNVLKTEIKKDASCEPINTEVAGLQELLGERRDEVKALIEKSKKEALSDDDLGKIKKYVEDVTKKVLSTAELFNRNNTCFLEDKKKIGFGDLASITLDATALAKTIAGPWATPISLGGQALAGIFQGLASVVQSRQGYDFTKLEQRQSYVQSLCAYYNYRTDIEYLLYPDKRVGQLKSLESTLGTHLKGVVDNCPECAPLAKKVIANLKDAKGKASKPTDEINADAVRVNSLYVRPLGTYTVKTLATLKWVSGEVERIQEESSDDANIGRDFLSEVKVDIDRFMFEREGPSFVNFQAQKGYDLFREFHNYVVGEGETIQMQAYALTKKYQNLSSLNEAEAIKAIAALADPVKAAGQNGLASRIADFQRKSLELYDRTRIAASVNETYCAFFQRAGVYNSNLQYACEGMTANALRRNLQRLAGNAFVPQPVLPGQPPVEYVTDWVDSLTKVIGSINGDPNRYKKKEVPSAPLPLW